MPHKFSSIPPVICLTALALRFLMELQKHLFWSLKEQSVINCRKESELDVLNTSSLDARLKPPNFTKNLHDLVNATQNFLQFLKANFSSNMDSIRPPIITLLHDGEVNSLWLDLCDFNAVQLNAGAPRILFSHMINEKWYESSYVSLVMKILIAYGCLYKSKLVSPFFRDIFPHHKLRLRGLRASADWKNLFQQQNRSIFQLSSFLFSCSLQKLWWNLQIWSKKRRCVHH